MEYIISATGFDDDNNIIDECIHDVIVYDYESAVREFDGMKRYVRGFAGYSEAFKRNVTYCIGVYVEDEFGYLEIYDDLEAEVR